ncbi:hypothetical protein LJC07_04610 [Christensenellaceae bacterium OttesenSCG-928-L17]|nr:hypothetical protein [Christensenellaceae bacterium OttesenSCG-928-L17]
MERISLTEFKENMGAYILELLTHGDSICVETDLGSFVIVPKDEHDLVLGAFKAIKANESLE